MDQDTDSILVFEKPLPPPWRHLRCFESLPSTQRYAGERLAAGEDLRGVVIWADRQTAGRGRLDHSWASEAGGIYVTAAFPHPLPLAPQEMGWTAIIAAMACIEAIRARLGLTPQLKWPNDILLDGRKVAGLLGEIKRVPTIGPDAPAARERLVLMGLGLNWSNDVRPAAQAGGFSAASLAEFRAGLSPAGRENFLLAWLARLDAWCRRLNGDPNQALRFLLEEVESILWCRGQPVIMQNTEQGPIEGILLGVGQGGAARLRLAGGNEIEVHCGWQSATRVETE